MRSLLSLVCLGLVLVLGAAAQTFRGGINGVITDESGAVIDSALVKATSQTTGRSYSGLSSSAGEFAFPDLPLGDYIVTVAQPGFENMTVKDVHVSAGAVYTLPIKLHVARAVSTVEVSGRRWRSKPPRPCRLPRCPPRRCRTSR